MLDGCAIHIEGVDKLRNGLTWGDDARKDRRFNGWQTALDERIFKEEIVQMFVDHAVHPVKDLALSAVSKMPDFFVTFSKSRMTAQSSKRPVFLIAEHR